MFVLLFNSEIFLEESIVCNSLIRKIFYIIVENKLLLENIEI